MILWRNYHFLSSLNFTSPRFQKFLLYIGCKSWVTFVKRFFHIGSFLFFNLLVPYFKWYQFSNEEQFSFISDQMSFQTSIAIYYLLPSKHVSLMASFMIGCGLNPEHPQPHNINFKPENSMYTGWLRMVKYIEIMHCKQLLKLITTLFTDVQMLFSPWRCAS